MTTPRIAVVHEVRARREQLLELLDNHGEVSLFASGDELLASSSLRELDCVFAESEAARRILLHMAEARIATPVISLASQPEVGMAVEAIRQGAVDYLSSQSSDDLLLRALEAALRQRRTGVPDRFFSSHLQSGHPELPLEAMLDGLERELINRALLRSRGVVGGSHGAAALLGVTRTGLLYKMKRLHIHRLDGVEADGAAVGVEGSDVESVGEDASERSAGSYGDSSSSTT